jgi:Breast carcinoma amplified sequence 2 (BCAS2)
MDSSLPYLDAIHPDYEEYALSLLEQEMPLVVARPTKTDQLKDPSQFASELLQQEFRRAERLRQNSNPGEESIDGNVHESGASSDFNKPHHLVDRPVSSLESEWQEAVRQARTAYEYERLRALRLEIDREPYSAANSTASSSVAWQQYNQVFEPILQSMTEQVKQEKQQIEGINYQRQQHQEVQVGPMLSRLTAQYQERLPQLQLLKQAVYDLEQELGVSTSPNRNE